MKIAIDIDDTIAHTTLNVLKYADKFMKEKGLSLKNHNISKKEDSEYLKNIYDKEDNIKIECFNKYYKNILEDSEMISDANIIINKLKEVGNEIFFVTARSSKFNCDAKKLTEDFLNRYNINYDGLFIDEKEKVPKFLELGIDLCIDDSYDVCKNATEKGIKALLMTSPLNEDIAINNEVTRVNSWAEIEREIRNI